MSQFSSSCDYCSDRLFTIDISGDNLRLLNSQNYYTCLKCEKLDLCYKCYSKLFDDNDDENRFLEKVNNSILYKFSNSCVCQKHDLQHCDAYRLPPYFTENKEDYLMSGFDYDYNYDLDDQIINDYFDIQSIMSFGDSCYEQ